MALACDPQKLPVTKVREAEGRKLMEDGWQTIHPSVCAEGWGVGGGPRGVRDGRVCGGGALLT